MNAVVICALFKGSEKVEIIDSKEYSGDFVSNFNAAYDYLLSKLNTNFIIKGKERTSRLEMPEEALREALINAMVHRDYFSPGHVQIDIFIDRVEISNPGRLLFDKEELGTVSIPRNPLIMDLAFRIDLVERVGSGIRRIRELCAEYGLRVDFNSGDVFRVVFHREKVTKKVTKTTQKTTQKSSQKTVEKTVEKILALIKENPSITSAEIQAKTGLTRRVYRMEPV